jgi:hypothetical protein
MATANVFTWEDINGNGKVDEGETPIPFVTTSVGYPDSLTSSNGWAKPGKFMPGCRRSCWSGQIVQVKVPPGFKPTTPTEYSLTGESDNYYFGFQVSDQKEIIAFPDEPNWQQAFINRGVRVLAFQYTNNRKLEITLDREGTIVDTYYPESFLTDRFYFSIFVFDVVLELQSTRAANISDMHITLMPSGKTFICKTDEISQWDGRISGLEILTEHCEHE